MVLAAGLGSRYGSLKQLDQFGPSGETIVDYAVYDAIKAGFEKIIFIIRKDIEAEFKEIFYVNRFFLGILFDSLLEKSLQENLHLISHQLRFFP